MHESSLAASILSIVRETAEREGSGPVVQVDLCVGELAGVEENTLRACFEMLAEGTVAHGARLVVDRIEATGVCTKCGGQARRTGKLLRCPQCADAFVTLQTGRELYVKSIELERPKRSHDHAQRM